MAINNAEWCLKNGYSFYDLDCNSVEEEGEYDIFVGDTCIDTIKTDDSPLGAMLKWLDAEHKETEAKHTDAKHAHWIHDHDVEHYGKSDGAYWRCSSCGRILKDSNWFSYCPMCGARMDGEIEARRK